MVFLVGDMTRSSIDAALASGIESSYCLRELPWFRTCCIMES